MSQLHAARLTAARRKARPVRPPGPRRGVDGRRLLTRSCEKAARRLAQWERTFDVSVVANADTVQVRGKGGGVRRFAPLRAAERSGQWLLPSR